MTYIPTIAVQYSDTTTQTIANTALGQAITLNTNDLTSLTITHSTSVNPSRIYVTKKGRYAIHGESQVSCTSANKTAYFWLRVDGVDVAATTTTVKVVNANDEKTVTIVFNKSLNAGQYIELIFGGTSTNMALKADATVITPTRPTTPSIIVTVELI